MQAYFDLIDNANDIDELTEIVEERAAFDDRITNQEYCAIVFIHIYFCLWKNLFYHIIIIHPIVL